MIFRILAPVLLFVLAIPIVTTYRIFPVEGTPYWLFTVLFILLGLNIVLALGSDQKKRLIKYSTLAGWLFGGVVAIVVFGPMITAIADRAKTAPAYGVHDIILQQEAAMRYLIEGKNPYKEKYFGTPLESWHYDELGKSAVNPALYHFVMPPWYLLFPFLFYFVSIPLVGYFDARLVLVFCLLLLLLTLRRWYKDSHISLFSMTLVSMSPGVIDYMIEGRSDVFALSWLVLSLYLLERKRYVLSALVFALSVVSKQTVWFAVPFYVGYMWYQSKKSSPRIITSLAVFTGIVAVLVGPFLLWDGKAFVDSVVWYLSGNAPNSYPISGYGLGMLLYSMGIIRNIHESYPFGIWQGVLGVPVLLFTLRWLKEKPTLSRLLLGYTLFLGVIWWASRYFNNSHLGYLGTLLVLGMTKYWDEEAAS